MDWEIGVREAFMQSEIHIREVREDDFEAISVLMSEMGYPIGKKTVRANLRAIQALSPLYGVFVAATSQRVVGVVSAFVSPVLHRPKPVGRVSILAVRQSHVGLGIGTALLLRAEAFLQSLGCGRIEVTSAEHRLEAHDFYRRRGYSQQGIRFIREISARKSKQ
jgi:GNAT superfamily N-acetyltransferase